MNGRMQNEMMINKKIEIRLESLPQYVSGWHTNMMASRKTARTRDEYVRTIERLLRSIDQDVKNITPKEITRESVINYFLSVQTKEKYGEIVYTSDSYQSAVWFCINNFLNYLESVNLIDKNYIKEIDKPVNRDLDRINEHRVQLTGDDFKKILKEIDNENDQWLRTRNKAIILLFMNTGMRKTALMTITLEDVSMKDNELSIIDKGNKRHTYTLNEQTRHAMALWLGFRSFLFKGDIPSDDHLFISSNGTILSRRALDNIVAKYTKKALGTPLSPHKLRAGFCSILYDQTHDIEFVRRAVGHANVATTQRYIVTNGTEKKKAAEIMGSLL